jgi:hypothetical protein
MGYDSPICCHCATIVFEVSALDRSRWRRRSREIYLQPLEKITTLFGCDLSFLRLRMQFSSGRGFFVRHLLCSLVQVSPSPSGSLFTGNGLATCLHRCIEQGLNFGSL